MPRILFAFVLCSALQAAAQPPGYYSSVDTRNATTLRATLHPVIDDHRRLPYTSSSTDTWDVLESAWESSSTRIVDVYRNRSFRKFNDRVSGYNREHLWPRSLGFPTNDADNYPFTDCHGLALCDAGYNTSRSNKPFDSCSASCSENPTDSNGGVGGGSGSYPGNSNWTSGSFTSGRWEVWRHRRGDVARALFYLDIRYEGGRHGTTNSPEPDLILTDELRLIQNSQSSSTNLSVAYMGMLSTLLQWHVDDPVDAQERARNEVIFQNQGNRNPFVDNPSWVDIMWNGGSGSVPGQFTNYGTGCVGANGFAPRFQALGVPLINQSFTAFVSGAEANRPAILNIDINRQNIDLSGIGFPGCTGLALVVFDVAAQTNSIGIATTVLPVPNDPFLVNQSLHGQWVVLDSAPRAFAMSNGGTMTFGRL